MATWARPILLAAAKRRIGEKKTLAASIPLGYNAPFTCGAQPIRADGHHRIARLLSDATRARCPVWMNTWLGCVHPTVRNAVACGYHPKR